jgi:hypothetical protein
LIYIYNKNQLNDLAKRQSILILDEDLNYHLVTRFTSLRRNDPNVEDNEFWQDETGRFLGLAAETEEGLFIPYNRIDKILITIPVELEM